MTRPAELSEKAEAIGPATLAENFLRTMAEGKIADAYEQVVTAASRLRGMTNVLEALKNQTSAFPIAYGDMKSFEQVFQEKMGTCIHKIVYAVKYERMVAVMQFTFYRPEGDQWIVTGISIKN